MKQDSRTWFSVVGESLDLFELYEFCQKNINVNLLDGKGTYNSHLIRKLSDDAGKLQPFNKIVKNIFCKNDSPHKIPFLPLERLNEGFGKEEYAFIIQQVIDSGEFTSGPYIEKLEKALQYVFGFKNIILCSSGTDALIIALKSMGIGQGDEVIIPPNSFAATENAVFAVGALPVLADIDAVTYNICPSSVKQKITSKTKCIIPVHLYGNLAPIKELSNISKQYGIKVIEDACQAIGLSGVGEDSDAAILSFNPFKNLGGLGKAGAIVSKNDQIARNCHSFSYHGFIKDKKNIKQTSYGFNSRIDNLQAAIICCKLKYLSLQNFKRICLADHYINRLSELEKAGKISLPKFHPHNIWHLFPIKILTTHPHRDFIKEILLKKYHIETDIYYPILTHHQKTILHGTLFKSVKLPKVEEVHHKLLHLPFHHNLTIFEQECVVNALIEIFEEKE